VRVGVCVDVRVCERVGVRVCERVGVRVCERVGVCVCERIGVRVCERIGERIGVRIGVRVCERIGVRVGVRTRERRHRIRLCTPLGPPHLDPAAVPRSSQCVRPSAIRTGAATNSLGATHDRSSASDPSTR